MKRLHYLPRISQQDELLKPLVHSNFSKGALFENELVMT